MKGVGVFKRMETTGELKLEEPRGSQVKDRERCGGKEEEMSRGGGRGGRTAGHALLYRAAGVDTRSLASTTRQVAHLIIFSYFLSLVFLFNFDSYGSYWI